MKNSIKKAIHAGLYTCFLLVLPFFQGCQFFVKNVNNTNNLCLQNPLLSLEFDPDHSTLTAIINKLTGEKYEVRGDAFSVQTTAFQYTQAELSRTDYKLSSESLISRYSNADITVTVSYELRPTDHFFQKKMEVIFLSATGLKNIVVSQIEFNTDEMALVCYRHPDFDWITEYIIAKHGNENRKRRPDDSEPVSTFFGRTALGGFFTGMEMSYDNSKLDHNSLVLSYNPNLKIKAGEHVTCENMYFGVYSKSIFDKRADEWIPLLPAEIVEKNVKAGTLKKVKDSPIRKVIPLPSESHAMVGMTSPILGPPRHGLMAFACGWHSQMEQGAYDSDEKLEGDLRSLDFLSGCGLDGVSDSHPWGGETEKMAQLRDGDNYVPDIRVRRFLEHAREIGLKVTQWPTMNNTHPWRKYGGPFRSDHPEWLRGTEGEKPDGIHPDYFLQCKANCLANEPFYNWLEKIILNDALGTGLYESWTMDGDFWGTGAYFDSTIPVTCQAENHDHLPGDSNYACQQRLDQLFAKVRNRYQDMYILSCRPKMDLGVWAQRNIDAAFTLIESGTGDSNIDAGNEVRTASRIRVHHHFFPHWIDMSLLFPSYQNPKNTRWPGSDIDYLMLSALSSSPNLLLYLPTKTGIPDKDKAEIRKWLEWGRKNIDYLLVRHDLFDWPGKGKVDGSAHLLGDHGLVFLFNSEKTQQNAEFALTPESIGFTGSSLVNIVQEYPANDQRETKLPGDIIRWTVPSESVVVLRITLKQ